MGGRGSRLFQESNRSSELPIFEDQRKIQQPDNYNKRFLSEFGLKEHLPAKVREKVIVHEKQHYLDHVEQIAIINHEGEIVFKKTGDQSKVKFDITLAKDNVLTHNHPAAIPILSPEDIETFVRSGAVEIRATGLTGQVVRVWKEPYANEISERFKEKYTEVFQESMKYAENRHHERIMQGVVKIEDTYEGMTPFYADNHPDFVKDQIDYFERHMDFKKYGINYARIKEV